MERELGQVRAIVTVRKTLNVVRIYAILISVVTSLTVGGTYLTEGQDVVLRDQTGEDPAECGTRIEEASLLLGQC